MVQSGNFRVINIYVSTVIIGPSFFTPQNSPPTPLSFSTSSPFKGVNVLRSALIKHSFKCVPLDVIVPAFMLECIQFCYLSSLLVRPLACIIQQAHLAISFTQSHSNRVLAALDTFIKLGYPFKSKSYVPFCD